jgi:acetyltransferase
MPAQGGIGFISHSGAFCAAVVDWARNQGFGFSQIVSLGNQTDVNETDMLPMLAADAHTRVIVLYMESVSDGRKFVEAAGEVTRTKPVIALKVGRFESGQKAAASHTGALAASDLAFDAAFEKAGIVRADSTEQMFDWARALENCPLSGGTRIAVLTNAGGPGVIAADSIETNGLSLAQLTGSTLTALTAMLPPAASVNNPVDMLASASPGQYASCLNLLLEDDNVDAVMVILPPPPMFKAEEVAEKLIEVITAQGGGSNPGKPVVIALLGSTNVAQAAQRFQRANVPTYPFPERAASALAVLARRAEFLTTDRQVTSGMTSGGDINTSRELRDFGVDSPPISLLKAYGIESAPILLTHSEEEAIAIAKDFGFPIVLKIASPDILHKSDVGGVILNIQDEVSLKNAYAKMMKHIKELIPEVRIDGVNIQRQIQQGQEMIAGMVRDAQFGPLMMFGSGGVEVEGLKDVAFALAPLDQAEARKMIHKTWAGRKLSGFRHIPPADEDSVIDVLIKLSRLAMENDHVEEIEINPLRVLNKSAVAVDLRMKLRQRE